VRACTGRDEVQRRAHLGEVLQDLPRGRGDVERDAAVGLAAIALVDATPWPYSVTVHLAAWAGLRAAELCGLQVGDVELPAPTINPNAPAKPGLVRVARTVIVLDGR
jgi:integrase